jgi:glycosyltransferase involved in cell wall biosynthesis
VLERVPGARLFFMGAKHPNPEVPPSRMAQRAIARAEELGLKDRAIFFKDWIPYAERVNYLLEADVAVSLHRDHVETRFSVRTRMTDYLWARLPMVLTGGDTLSDMVAAKGLGRVVPAEDVKAVAEALIEMLQSPIDRAQFDAVVDMFRWPRVAEPLVRYVTAPWRNGERNPVVAIPPVKVTPLAQLPFKAVASLRERGLRGLVSDVRSYLLWRWRRW